MLGVRRLSVSVSLVDLGQYKVKTALLFVFHVWNRCILLSVVRFLITGEENGESYCGWPN